MRMVANVTITSGVAVGMLLASSAIGETRSGGDTALFVVAVVDPFGEPIPGAKVEVRQAQRDVASQETGQAGFARFSVARKAKCDVVVTLPGFVTATRKGVSLEREGPTVIGIALALPDPCPPGRSRSGGVQVCM